MDIAAAGLNLRDNGNKVSLDSFVLTTVVLVLSTLVMFFLVVGRNFLERRGYKINPKSMLITYLLTISFCATNIAYYTQNKVIDKQFNDFSMAYIILVLLPFAAVLFGLLCAVGYMALIHGLDMIK